ncbi:hypothetical protein V2G26_017244 [Clonostachys chloroleuca]|uniref:FAD-binding PCMH-type domain-containing protein n=1 Tax=Clonostachys chloroleuca TaxID=1926264 RepID=A0AA35MAR4_9HYPO|nr:unnamed protein product [Clonostachys chloroleuca]
MKVTAIAAGAAALALPVLASRDCTKCCSSLAKIPSLKGKIYLPNTSAYDARLKTYYSANAALAPYCMVLPTSTEDVSAIAKVISTKECPFGIRSGAHSAFKGSNGVADGITVDFSYMNATTYHPDKKVASIQPGSNWGQAFEALSDYGVTVVGGRASVVGVGGFTTGGGYSFHTNTNGFACDNVVNFEVVLADGSIVNANANEHRDLWRALKGGSGNFGFVTRVDTRTIDHNQLWGGFAIFDITKHRDAVFGAYIDFVKEMDNDPASQLIASVQWDGKQRSLVAVVSNVNGIANAPIFDRILSIPGVSNTLSTGDIAKLVPQFTGPTPLGLYANWMTGQTKNDVRIMNFIEEKHAEYVEKMQAAAPGAVFSILISYQPVTKHQVSHGEANGGNSLGLEEVVKDGDTLMWLIAVTVDTAANQEKINHLTIEYRDAALAYAKSIGIHKEWKYLNYALGDQDPIKNYGPEVVDHLKATAKNYDPKGVFQKLRHSGFKLPA